MTLNKKYFTLLLVFTLCLQLAGQDYYNINNFLESEALRLSDEVIKLCIDNEALQKAGKELKAEIANLNQEIRKAEDNESNLIEELNSKKLEDKYTIEEQERQISKYVNQLKVLNKARMLRLGKIDELEAIIDSQVIALEQLEKIKNNLLTEMIKLKKEIAAYKKIVEEKDIKIKSQEKIIEGLSLKLGEFCTSITLDTRKGAVNAGESVKQNLGMFKELTLKSCLSSKTSLIKPAIRFKIYEGKPNENKTPICHTLEISLNDVTESEGIFYYEGGDTLPLDCKLNNSIEYHYTATFREQVIKTGILKKSKRDD